MKIKVFYSWQSDLSNKTNRNFIGRALEKAIAKVRTTSEVELDIAIDRDTQDVAGSPDISDTIFSKIRNATVLVADISIINNHFKENAAEQKLAFRPCSNPNVLIELGYAIRHLEWSSLICVFNKAYGDDRDLPFDLRQHRILFYKADESQAEVTTERDTLASNLQNALEMIIKARETNQQLIEKITGDYKGYSFKLNTQGKETIELARDKQVSDARIDFVEDNTFSIRLTECEAKNSRGENLVWSGEMTITSQSPKRMSGTLPWEYENFDTGQYQMGFKRFIVREQNGELWVCLLGEGIYGKEILIKNEGK